MNTDKISHFKAILRYGTSSYTEYLNGKRLNYACAIMKNKELTLTDIALSSGFASFASFNRVFRSVMGMTPTEYRTRGDNP